MVAKPRERADGTAVGPDPDYAVFCRGRLWVSSLKGTSLSAIDPAKNAVVAHARVGLGSSGLACADALWAANYGSGELLRLDPTIGRVLGRLDVGFALAR